MTRKKKYESVLKYVVKKAVSDKLGSDSDSGCHVFFVTFGLLSKLAVEQQQLLPGRFVNRRFEWRIEPKPQVTIGQQVKPQHGRQV